MEHKLTALERRVEEWRARREREGPPEWARVPNPRLAPNPRYRRLDQETVDTITQEADLEANGDQDQDHDETA